MLTIFVAEDIVQDRLDSSAAYEFSWLEGKLGVPKMRCLFANYAILTFEANGPASWRN